MQLVVPGDLGSRMSLIVSLCGRAPQTHGLARGPREGPSCLRWVGCRLGGLLGPSVVRSLRAAPFRPYLGWPRNGCVRKLSPLSHVATRVVGFGTQMKLNAGTKLMADIGLSHRPFHFVHGDITPWLLLYPL